MSGPGPGSGSESGSESGSGSSWRPARRSASRAFVRLGVAAGLFALLAGVVHAVGAATDGRPSTRSTARTPLPGTVASVWTLDATQARPDLEGARFLGSLDGDFASGFVADVRGTWVAVSGTKAAGDTAVHAIDPATGAVRWTRELDGALCTTEAPTSGLLCASALARDPATGLGTRWRLHRVDPSTGADLATTDVDAWLTAVHWTGRELVLLEQRQPAPHAVVRGFTADLRERWTLDLADQPGQAEMFSTNRVVNRQEPDREGLALDRPRLRDVGDGLVAVWAGQRTAVVDAGSGRLVMMPHCSRLVDDGRRLWCNEVDGVTGYTYEGRATVRVRGPRLAFPNDDGVGVDRNRPVFLDDDGAAVTVDVKTGAVGRPWTPPGRGSAFGETTMPSTGSTGGLTFLLGRAGAMLLDPDKDRVVWRNPEIGLSDVPVVVGDQVLLGTGRLRLVDLKTGASGAEVRVDGLYAVGLGDRVAGVGPERITLARL